MKDLPEQLHDTHLSELAIPGSHDSFAYDLDKSSSLAPDMTGSVIDKLSRFCCCIAKNIVWKWSLTQRLNFTQQLEAGIRYFDLRVATRPDTPDDDDGIDDLYLVHGLFGPRLEIALDSIQQFLNEHSQEIVLLDFNHFYRMNPADHGKCVRIIQNTFQDKLCPHQPEAVTLKWMWENHYQVIVFYHSISEEIKTYIPKDMLNNLWGGDLIPSPWHNVSNTEGLIKSLDKTHTEKKQCIQSRKEFHVTQGVLTPDAKLIVTRAGSSLKKHCGKAAAQPFVEWLKMRDHIGNSGVNICIMDFVEMEGFIETVIKLNDKLIKVNVDEPSTSALKSDSDERYSSTSELSKNMEMA